jgi:dimethylaniline monooxygenase (N-oxide forming)
VHFANGEVFENVDEIVCATGYKTTFKTLLDEAYDPKTFDLGGNGLFWHTFHPDSWEDIAVVGFIRPTFGSLPPIAELQARWVAKVWSGQKSLPSSEEMRHEIAKHVERRNALFGEPMAKYRASFEEFIPICMKLSQLGGFQVDLLYFFFFDFFLWIKLVLGPFSSARWRLSESLANRPYLMNLRLGRLSWIALKSTWRNRLWEYVTNTQNKHVYL